MDRGQVDEPLRSASEDELCVVDVGPIPGLDEASERGGNRRQLDKDVPDEHGRVVDGRLAQLPSEWDRRQRQQAERPHAPFKLCSRAVPRHRPYPRTLQAHLPLAAHDDQGRQLRQGRLALRTCNERRRGVLVASRSGETKSHEGHDSCQRCHQ